MNIFSSMFHGLPREERTRVRDIILRSCNITSRTFYRWLSGTEPNQLQQEKIAETFRIPREKIFPLTKGNAQYLELNVGLLKKIISNLPDDVVLADFEYGMKSFYVFNCIKKMIMVKDESGKQYLTINRVGAHYTDEHQLIWGIRPTSQQWI